jgi:hypothetical protein
VSGVPHTAVGGATSCRSCKAAIVFARSATTGKLMPFELDDAKGDWSLVNGVASHVGKAPAAAIAGVDPVPRYTSHFARCPAASEWRKR